jgi:hypothetical protein
LNFAWLLLLLLLCLAFALHLLCLCFAGYDIRNSLRFEFKFLFSTFRGIVYGQIVLLLSLISMRPLIIEATADTPMVYFDKYTDRFEIKGVSLPANIFEFYHPLIDWINDYCKNPNKETLLELKFDYLNSSSTKMILNLISSFEGIIRNGGKAAVIWHYDSGDTEMKDMGDEFASNCNIPFRIINDQD